jgi:hypothetical protein
MEGEIFACLEQMEPADALSREAEDFGSPGACGTPLPTPHSSRETRLMRSHSHSAASLRRFWTDGAWPVLAGSLAAVGVFGASRALGFAQFLAVYVALSLFTLAWVLALVFGVYQEIGHLGPRLVRIGLAAALVGMVLFGLAQLFAGYGLLAAAAAALTSPTATRRSARSRRPVDRAPTTPTTPTTPAVRRVLMDQEMVNREFEDIAARLSEMDDHSSES